MHAQPFRGVTDAELIVASRHDPAAFRELYDRWAERLLAYFYRRDVRPRGRRRPAGRDVPGGLRAPPPVPGHRPAGAAWLFGIAQKELAHWVRHRAAEQRAVRRLGIVVPVLDDESIARIEALADLAAHRQALTEALGRMTDLERDAAGCGSSRSWTTARSRPGSAAARARPGTASTAA